MTHRDNQYEAAFEAYLRSRQIPYVAIDESRRALLGQGSLKSLDFIVSPRSTDRSFLVDVKGRRFPSGRQYFKNWSTREELRSLSHWEELFGARFLGLLVFAYHVMGDRSPLPRDHLFSHGERLYAFVGVRLDHYACWSRTISPKWDTVSMRASLFRRLARPVEQIFLHGVEGKPNAPAVLAEASRADPCNAPEDQSRVAKPPAPAPRS